MLWYSQVSNERPCSFIVSFSCNKRKNPPPHPIHVFLCNKQKKSAHAAGLSHPALLFDFWEYVLSKNQCCLETLRNSKVWVANIVQLLESSIVKMLHAHQNYCVAVRSSGLVRFTSITHFLSFGGLSQSAYQGKLGQNSTDSQHRWAKDD